MVDYVAHLAPTPQAHRSTRSIRVQSGSDLTLSGDQAGSGIDLGLTLSDRQRGEERYVLCQACHGPHGQGTEALSAPPLIYLDDWYIESTLERFENGTLGSDPRDITGQQMAAMGALVAEKEDRRLIAAYITLSLQDSE